MDRRPWSKKSQRKMKPILLYLLAASFFIEGYSIGDHSLSP
jgi:hypothetical protein